MAGERIEFEFVGQVSTPLSLDPAEFAGRSVPQITADIMATLKSIDPRVSFFEDDAQLAAEQLFEAAKR